MESNEQARAQQEAQLAEQEQMRASILLRILTGDARERRSVTVMIFGLIFW